MSKALVIAEKPSVAQDIVRALTPVAGKFDKHDEHFENDTYVVTSAVGHLVEIQAPEEFDVKRGKWSFANLPVIPPHFDLKPVDKTKTRLNAVVKQARRKDVGTLINACDAGREGELIFRLIAQYAFDGKHAAKPVQRVDHAVFVDVKVEGVVGVLRVVRVAPLRLVPADDLAHVFDDACAARDVHQREHALAMHARAAHLDAPAGGGGARAGCGGFAGHGKTLLC